MTTLTDNHQQILAMRAREQAKYTPNLVQRFIAGLVAGTLFASRPLVLDVSDYQAKADGTTGADWLAITAQSKNFAGAYCKLGEPWDNQTVGTTGCDAWFESSFNSNLDGLQAAHKWAAPYLFLNTARWIGGDLISYQNMDNGTIDQRLEMWAHQDPHIYMLLRGLLIGTGRQITPPAGTTLREWLKSLPRKRFHAIILDLERWWKVYPIPANPGPTDIVANVWIAEVAVRTIKRIQLLMDWGILPQVPILFYSAVWFTEKYMGVQAPALDNYDAICAGYYWPSGRVTTTLADLSASILTQIPDTWRPRLFGKTARLMQISGDRFAIAEVVNNLGQWSGLDINVFWGSLAEMQAYFSSWSDKPLPVPTPPPAIYQKIATVIRACFMRKDPSTNNNPWFQELLPVGTRLVVLEDQVQGTDVWHRVTLEFWVAGEVNGIDYTKITTEPVPQVATLFSREDQPKSIDRDVQP